MVDPNVIGAFLVVVVVGIIALYAWSDLKKRPQYSTSYPPKHELSGQKCENCGGTTERLDAEKIRCQYCGRVFDKPLPEKPVTVRETQEERKQENKQKRIIWEYDPIEYEYASKDPLLDFAEDANKTQENEY
ncbi:MAG: hypothetical protein ABSC20_12400 [Candidatus Bathyarchaeia archaeon]|jgi:DNA-directed RNA polymerase subunit RPC12/RpoP